MPRKLRRAAAGHNLLFGPPGTPFPGWQGRGSLQARGQAIGIIGIARVAEFLFEGTTDVSLRECSIRGDGFAETDAIGSILTEQVQFSHASLNSIDFNGSGLGHVRADVAIPVWYGWELWFKDNFFERRSIERMMVGMNNNSSNNPVGIYNSGTRRNSFPSGTNSFNNDNKWDSEVHLEGQVGQGGEGKVRCLFFFHDTGDINNFVVCIDGMPVAADSQGGISADNLPAFNGRSGELDGFKGALGSSTWYNNGANLTLRDVREIFEKSALSLHCDMLTIPRWYQLDSADLTLLAQTRERDVILGAVENSTGVRSGAIQRLADNGDRRNTYFELEILDEGDAPPAGIEDDTIILDGAMTASTFFQAGQESFQGRLNNPDIAPLNGWRPSTNNTGEWLKIDLGAVVTVVASQTQGAAGASFRMNTYGLDYNDDNGGSWTAYNGDESLPGNVDSGSVVTNILIPFTARYVRFRPKSWNGSIAARVELLLGTGSCLVGLRKLAESGAVGDVSENPDDAIYIKGGKLYDGANVLLPTGSDEFEQDSTTLANATTGQVFQFAIPWNEFNPQMLFVGDGNIWKGQDGDDLPEVGLESGAILDAQLSASTFFDADRDPRHARLNNTNPNYWQANVQDLTQWWKIDFGEVVRIGQIASQGATVGTARILTYKLEYNDDDSATWIPYNGGEILTGNTANATDVITNLLIPFSCRYLRVRAQTWNAAQSARFEFYFENSVSPELFNRGLNFMDTAFNWAAWLRINGAAGNGSVRLRAKRGSFLYPIPENYVPWDDDELVDELLPSGPNRRQHVLNYLGTDVRRAIGVRYKFEGNTQALTARMSGFTNQRFADGLTFTVSYLLSEFNSEQLSHASPVSLGLTRTANAYIEEGSSSPEHDPFNSYEFWFKQHTYYSHTKNGLFGSPGNRWVHMGIHFEKNYPTLQNFFNLDVAWEAEFDCPYADDVPHCLLEAHETTMNTSSVYVVYWDGVPIASGSNGGWNFSSNSNRRGFEFNPDCNTGNLNRSGARFGYFGTTRGGNLLNMSDVRKMFEATALTAPGAQSPAGLESGAVLDAQLSASSQFDAPRGPEFARLNNADGSHWSPLNALTSEWWKIDFGAIVTVASISTQGGGGSANWLTTYKLEYNNDDSASWTPYNSDEVLLANVDNSAVVTNQLILFQCRYLRVRPNTWQSFPSMRAEFGLGSAGRNETPVGIEDGTILDAQMTANSESGGFPSEQARLNEAANGWIQAATYDQDDWLQIDFIQRRRIFQIHTQGSFVAARYVTGYELEYSDDGISFTSYNNNENLVGNISGADDSIVTHDLIPFSARYVRFLPKTWASDPEVRLEFSFGFYEHQDILNHPYWVGRDSVNCVVSEGGRDVVMGTVDNDTGIRTGAIPRRGKVYFELEIIDEGDSTAASNVGLRQLAEASPVGDFPRGATEGYHTDGQGDVFDGDEIDLSITGTLGTAATGRIFQFAIDWETGDWWIGTDNTLWAGIGGAGNPVTGENPLPALDIDHNWGASINISDADGAGTVRLLHALSPCNFAPPAGFSTWADAEIPLEVDDNYSLTVKVDNPVGYWRLDEFTGGVFKDEVGGNNLHRRGNVLAGVSSLISTGTCLDFAGLIEQTLRSNIAPNAQLLGDMTMEVWINLDSRFSNEYMISCQEDGETENTNYCFGMAVTSSGQLRYFHEYGAGSNEAHNTIATPIALSTNLHVVCVRDDAAKTVDVYVNAVFIETLTYTNSPTGGGLTRIIVGHTATAGDLDGRVDQPAVYDFKLPFDRLERHYFEGLAPTDSLIANVVLLVRSNLVPDGQITFVDDSPSAHTLSRQGNVIYDDGQNKFGNEAAMLFDGTNDWVSIPDTPDLGFEIRTVEFCIEAWIYVTDNTSQSAIFDGRDSGGNEEFSFYVNLGTSLNFVLWGAVDAIITAGAVLTINQWQHVAVTRTLNGSDGDLELFVDGVSVATLTQTSNTDTNTGTYNIGHNAFNNTRDFTGSIDSIRVTRNNPRYVGNFTPDLFQFPDS